MKKLLLAMIAVAALISFAACDHNETYADQRDRELDSINAFLRNENIKVINEAEFEKRFEARKAGDKTVKLTDTDPNNNEYVLFESNGIYMQVLEPGCGDYIKKDHSEEVLVRFDEYSLNLRAKICDAALTCSNNHVGASFNVDKLRVTNTSGTFTGLFVEPLKSVFALTYNQSGYTSSGVSGTVPSGWLIPFSWVKIGRGNAEGEKLAHVRLLVPHTYGSTTASGSVYSCLYDMTLQKGR